MYVLGETSPAPAGIRGGVVAIGNFDGVHLGHQALLHAGLEVAENIGKPLGVLTFEPHPRSFFRPDEPVFRLSPKAWKLRLLKAMGVQFTDIATFDRALASLEAAEFVERILLERLGVAHVVTGYDFHFGRGRKGSPDALRGFGEKHGFGVTIVDQVTGADGVAPYSSSYIRTALRRGHVSHAASQLGYWWSLMGTVVEGDKRGREIGYPTVNIALPPGCEPHEGIYAVRVRRAANGADCWRGAAYIGYRPTFETSRLFLEVYLFDFEGDLYGEELIVEFISFIRPDRKFDGLEPLLEQMAKDCTEINRRLETIAQDDPM
ncbi:MAG TPA: bifunctional riboflavin kinase/FAD synthetase, partial [Rhizobiales bacterium]|nr:bifunctional riboflavin kinase/FAD synthetase [Hyphomicrobiales bacterium]